MSVEDDNNTRENRIRALAEREGYQLRRADGVSDMWHLVDPRIDGKAYAFSFTHPHSFTLQQIEDLLHKRAQGSGGSDENAG